MLAAAAVVAVGYYAWQRFDGLVSELEEMAKPNVPLTAMRAIKNDLFLAENSVRTFNITRHEEDLLLYNAAYDSIGRQIALLESVQSNIAHADTSISLARIDVLRGLINRKIEIQDQLVEIIREEPGEGIGEVLATLDSVAPYTVVKVETREIKTTREEVITDTTKVITKGILGLGKPRVKELKKPKANKRNVIDTVQVEEVNTYKDTLPPEVSSANLVRSLKRSTELIQERLRELDAQKLAVISQITAADQRKMDSISLLLNEMEVDEKALIETRTTEAANRTGQSKSFILQYSLASLGLFLLLILIIFWDMTRNRRLQRRLAAEKARAEKLAKAKEEFLANMSHEIRTPMNAIIGFTEQLGQTRLNDAQKRFLVPVQHSAQYLLALINDVLDYSKLESGKFTLEAIAFAPIQVLREACDTFRDRAETKGLELRLQTHEDLPQVLIGDPLRLKQMLFNLLNNAIKFTDAGHVELACQASPLAGGKVQLAFRVSDTGAGIPADKLKTIFAKFTQADSSTTRKYGGTGLGLAITQELAELHGGEIQVTSQPQKGTQITLLIPYLEGRPDQIQAADTPLVKTTRALRDKHALVADDEPYNRELIRAILDKWGVEAEIVENGALAVDRLRAQQFDFVLMDLQMPELDGLAATRQIRTELALDLPVIALTATSTPADREACARAGMNGMILKPFREAELYQQLLDLLHIDPSSETVEATLPHNDAPLSSNEAYAFDELYELANRDLGFMRNMLNIFIQSAQTNLHEMQEALAQQDWNGVSMKAHKLIPPCRHLGLDTIVLQLKQIERETGNGTPDEDFPARVHAVHEQITQIVISLKEDLRTLIPEA